MSVEVFEGFPAEGLEFLEQLAGRDKAWFDERRKTYDKAVAGPAKAFVQALGEELRADISGAIDAVPKVNGSISPINNDLRFNPGADPYKDHLLFRFWEGPAKKTAPTLFVRMSKHQTGFASGVVPESLERWRDAIASPPGAELSAAIESLGERRDTEVAGQSLKRVPKGYDGEHSREGLLRHKAFQVRWVEDTPPAVHNSAFVQWCAQRLELCAPVHHWLVEHTL